MDEASSEIAGSVPIRIQRWDTFLSYARDDATAARNLRVELRRQKIAVWKASPRSVNQTSRRHPRREGLAASATFVVLFSGASPASPRVLKELALARRTLPLERIVCILLPGVGLSALPTWLRNQPIMHLASQDQTPVLAKELKKRISHSLRVDGGEEAPARTTTIGYFPPPARLVGVEEYHAQLLARQSGLTWVAGAAGTGKTALAADFVRRYSHGFREVVWVGSLPGLDQSKLLDGMFGGGEGRAGGLFVVDASSVETFETPWFARLSGVLSASNRVIVTTQDLTDVRPFADELQDLIILSKQGRAVDRVRRRWETLLADAPTVPIPIIRDAADADTDLWRRDTAAKAWRPEAKELGSELSPQELSHHLMSLFSPLERDRLAFAAFTPDLWLGGRFSKTYREPADDEIVQRLLLMNAIERSPDGLVLHHLLAASLRLRADEGVLETLVRRIRSRLPSPSAKAAVDILPGVSHFLDLARQSPGSGTQSFVDLAIWIASVWRAAGSPYRAQQVADYARALTDSLDDPETRVRVMNLLSAIAADQGRHHESASLERRAIEIATAELGATHPATLAAIANFASSLSQQGQHAEAISVLRFVLSQLDTGTTGASDDRTAVQIALGGAYRDAGLADDALQTLSDLHPDDRGLRARLEQEVISSLLAAGRASEALPRLRAAISKAEKETDRIDWLGRLALALDKIGDRAEALETQYESVGKAQTYLGDLHPSTMGARANLAILLNAEGEYEESLRIATSVAEQRRVALGEDSQPYLATLIICGAVAERLGLTDRAAEQYRLAITGYARTMGDGAIATLRARERLTRLLRETSSSASTNSMAEELLVDVRAVLPADHPMTRRIEDLAVGGRS